jgi:hypothetical protein
MSIFMSSPPDGAQRAAFLKARRQRSVASASLYREETPEA